MSVPGGSNQFVSYESRNRELKRRLIYECRCDERLKTKVEGSGHLRYTGLCGGPEHLKSRIETGYFRTKDKTNIWVSVR